MVEEKNFVLETDHELGEIVIAPEVIEIIIGIAAANVEGVYAMRGTFTNNVNELLGRTAHGKGVYLSNNEEGIVIDVYCYMKYGVSVPKVAMEIQKVVKQQVMFMTDVELSEVNVHIVAVVPEKTEKMTFEELFEKDEDDNE